MSDMDKKLEEILDEFYQMVFEHAYELGQELPEQKNPQMVFDPCNETDRQKAKKAVLAWVEQDIIGEDEEDPSGDQYYIGRNELRAEQRKKLRA